MNMSVTNVELFDRNTITENVKQAYAAIAKLYKQNIKSDKLDRRFVEEFLTLFKPGQKILDVGTGTGSIAKHMATAHKLNVTAIDV